MHALTEHTPTQTHKNLSQNRTEVPHDLHARAAVSKHDGVHPNATFDRIDAVALVVVATPEWNTGLVNMASHVGYGM